MVRKLGAKAEGGESREEIRERITTCICGATSSLEKSLIEYKKE